MKKSKAYQPDLIENLRDVGEAGEYLNAGTRLIWIGDGQRKTIDVYRTGGERTVLTGGAVLNGLRGLGHRHRLPTSDATQSAVEGGCGVAGTHDLRRSSPPL